VAAVRDRERQHARADRLRAAAEQYRATQQQLRTIHSQGRAPANIIIRRSLLHRRDAGGPSAAAQLITPRGLGLSLYLTALFDAQSRRPPGALIRNLRPLLPTGNDVGWTELILAVATGSHPDDGALRQLHRALTALERVRLVELRRRGAPGRYEHFKLLEESGGGARGRTGYVIPSRGTAARGTLLEVPAAFFLNGWANILLPAETLVYLIVADLQIRHGTDTVFIADSTKELYSISRDVYEHHRALTAYGLLHRLDNPHRGPDGRILHRPDFEQRPHPHHFQLVPRALEANALKTISTALSCGW